MSSRLAATITLAVMVTLFAIPVSGLATGQSEQAVSPDVVLDVGIVRPSASDLRAYSQQVGSGAELSAGTVVAPRAGQPNILSARSPLSAALLTTFGGRGTQFSEVTLLADWDGREDLCADRQRKIADFSGLETEPDVTLTRVAISEHTIANGFAENIFYYGDSVGNVYVGADTSGDGIVDVVTTINLPTVLNAFGTLNSDDQIVVTGLGVNPVADLTSYANVNSSFTTFTGQIGEMLYVSYWDTGSGLRLAVNNTLVRSGVLAFPIADLVSSDATPPGVISQIGFPVTVGGGFGVAFSVYGNLAGLAVDDDGNVYFQQVDLVQFTGGNIVKIASVDQPGALGNQDRSLATSGFLTLTTLNPTGGQYGTSSGPSNQINRYTNYSGTSTVFGNISALACGSCNTLYAAVARSYRTADDPGAQATEGLFTNPSTVGDTPAMIISFADVTGAFDVCSSPATGVPGIIPVADGFADPVPGAPTGVNWKAFVLGNGPDRRAAGDPVYGSVGTTLKLDMQIDYTIYCGLAVDEDSKLYMISGGTPGGIGRNPSPNVTEVLCFPDQCPADRRADYVDLRGDTLPNPPASGGNVGDGDSDRFDHIFTVAPMDQVTLTPTGMAGLARGFLLYLNRTRPDTLSVLPNGTVQGDDTTTGPVIFEDFDAGHQVAGGDDQNPPFTGDDLDGAGDPIVTAPLAGGFEFTLGNQGNPSACVWNGFWLNSNGSITFGGGDEANISSVQSLRSGLPRIAGAWCDLNPSSRAGFKNTFPVQALGFAAVNHFKVRYINVPEFGGEACGNSNTFAISLMDDGTGADENAPPPAIEGPTDKRFVREPVTGSVVGEPPRQDGTGHFCTKYCRMDALGTPNNPVLVGYSIGGLSPLNPPGLCEVDLSEAARQAEQGVFGVLPGSQIASIRRCLIGEGTEPTVYEFFNSGQPGSVSGGGQIVPAVPDFDLRAEGNDAAAASPLGQPDPNRGKVCFYGTTCSPPGNPTCLVIAPEPFATTPGSTGLINVLCGATIDILGYGFYPNEVTTICGGPGVTRAGKTVSTAILIQMDCNNDGIPETNVPLVNVTPLNPNLVRATLAPLPDSGLPGTPFPLGCCGGNANFVLTTLFTAGDNNVFGRFTRTTTCVYDLGHRAPVVISASPSNGDCSLLQDLTITGSCFMTPFGNATGAFAVQLGNPGNVVNASNFQVLSASLADALFNFGAANCGKTFLVFVEGPGGISRNMVAQVPGEQPGCPLGNEQGVNVKFKCNDFTPPTVTCPANITVCADKRVNRVRGAYVTYPPGTATDNCGGGAVSVACTPPSGSFFPTGTQTITCTATDAAGNTATCNFTVTVTNKRSRR
jgi:hypothetical protein